MGFGADQRNKALKGPVVPGLRAHTDTHARPDPVGLPNRAG